LFHCCPIRDEERKRNYFSFFFLWSFFISFFVEEEDTKRIQNQTAVIRRARQCKCEKKGQTCYTGYTHRSRCVYVSIFLFAPLIFGARATNSSPLSLKHLKDDFRLKLTPPLFFKYRKSFFFCLFD